MPWFKVDDTFALHAKVLAAGNAAVGLWVRAGAWSMQQLTDGFVPTHVARTLGTVKEARALVAAGLWVEVEDGYQFHQWEDVQRSKDQVKADRHAATERQRRARETAKSQRESRRDTSVSHGPPDQTRPEGSSSGTTDSTTAVAEVPRPDIDRICAHLADRIEANGAKRPEIGVRWRDAARLLLDRDQRTEQQVHDAIDWCQDDEFWRANVLSLPKLREQYEQLRLQAQRGRGGQPRGRQQDTDDVFARAAARMTDRQEEATR